MYTMKKYLRIPIYIAICLIIFYNACDDHFTTDDPPQTAKWIQGTILDSISGNLLDSATIILGSINDTTYMYGPVNSDSSGYYIIFAGGGGETDSYIEASKNNYESKRVFYSSLFFNNDTATIDFFLIKQ